MDGAAAALVRPGLGSEERTHLGKCFLMGVVGEVLLTPRP